MADTNSTGPLSGKTAWARNLETPLREFLRTETGSAGVLLPATVAALRLGQRRRVVLRRALDDASCRSGSATHGIALDLRGWVNSGLMTFFFFVVGLEARREFDMGELRERRRVALPVLAGLGGMVVPVAIYLAINAGRPSAHGWGAAMSTDTAFALGMLALVGPRFPDRLRAFLLTVVVVDDLVALTVIALFYSDDVVAAAAAGRARRARRDPGRAAARLRVGPVYVAARRRRLGGAARSPASTRSSSAWRWACSPTPRPPRAATWSAPPTCSGSSASSRRPSWPARPQSGVRTAISPNERLQQLFHPWTSYVIVPLFALANAGIVIERRASSRGPSPRRSRSAS